jgi:integrase
MALHLLAPGTRKGNKFYVVYGRDETGKMVEKSTKCLNKRDAEAWLRSYLRDAASEAEPAAPAPSGPAAEVVPIAVGRTMAAAVVAYAKSRGLDLDYRHNPSVLRANSPFTSGQREEMRRLNQLRRPPLGNLLAADVVANDIITLANTFDRLLPSTKNRDFVVTASAVLNYARKGLGWRTASAEIPRFKEGKQRTRVVNQDAEAAMIAGCHTAQQRRLLVWLFCQGTRITETINVRWAAVIDDAGVDLDRRVVRMRVKGDEIKEFPLADEVIAELEAIPAAERQGKVFSYGDRHNVYRWLTPLANKCGFHFTPHQARHTVGTRANAAGAGLRTIMDMLGHKDFRSSMRYQSSDIEVTRSAINLLRKRSSDAS